MLKAKYHKFLHNDGGILIESTRKANCKIESVGLDASEFVVLDEIEGEWIIKEVKKNGREEIVRDYAPGVYKLYFRKINNQWKIILDNMVGL